MSRVPRIRFKGFEEDWEQRKLGDIVREVTRVDENSNAPVMMITANDGFIEQSERYSTDNAGKSLKKYILLKKWELAYNHGASKIRPFGSCFALTSVANIRIPFVYHCFLALEDNSEFLEYTLNSKNVENQLRKIVSSGARMDGLLNISFQEYTSIFIRCPIRKEQDIIAILIKSLDHLITLHRSKFFGDILKTIASYALYWEQRKLGEVFEEYSEKNHSELPPLAIIQGGGTIRRDESDRALQYDRNSLSNYKMVNKGDFIVHLRSFEGGLEKANSTGIVSPAYHTFSGENTDTTFYYAYFRSEKFIESDLKPHVYGIRDGRSIDVEGMKSINIPYTIFDEQRRIGEFINSINHLITLHQRKLEKLKIIKKSMLENLFPQNGEKTPKIRFSGFTKDWEQRKLGDYLEVSEEKNLNNEYTKENVLSVSGDVGIVNQIEFQGRSFAGILVNNYGVVKTGYVVYTKSPLKNNPYGIIKANKGRDGIVSTLYAIYKPKVNVNSNFIQIYFEQNARMNNYMQPLVNKGAKNDMKISSENALKGNVIFPIRIEQDIIVDFFFKIDHLITLHQSKLDKLQKIKKSMLESMFV